MIEKVKALGGVLLGIAIFVCVLALLVVFIKGSLWASEHLLQPLIVIGWIALALNILILLPLSIFKWLRGFTGGGIFLSSYIFGLVSWLLGFVLTYALWGLWAVIFGILFLGGGVVPIALLATLFKGLWEPFFTLIVLTVITFGSRVGGLLIASSASE
ncbi:MAG: hypothetical protein ACYDCJ_10240 [Gammaproteobacteria bacterium]